ncbi:hypothetical protein SHIRM173S_09607 [Streptomyces hirsutus]
MLIDPSSGKVLGSERDDDDDDAAEVRAALKGTSVTAEEAAKAAAAKGTVTSVDLDDDDTEGWEVETVTAGGGRPGVAGWPERAARSPRTTTRTTATTAQRRSGRTSEPATSQQTGGAGEGARTALPVRSRRPSRTGPGPGVSPASAPPPVRPPRGTDPVRRR